MATGQNTAPITLKHLATIEEFREALRLQKEIWGFADIELLPLRLFVVAHKVGGQLIGAFDGEEMIAFLIAIPGLKHGVQYLHSHMMGVASGYRDRGIGRRLKLAQREEALARGIELVEWTFDPLELKNAYFNIMRLGAVVRRYVLNQYGTTSSPLHGGLPTDRCIAEWYLSSARVDAVLKDIAPKTSAVLDRVAIPMNIAELRVKEPARAREIQRRASERFLANFSAGLEVSGFERTDDEGIYLFTKIEEPAQ